MPGEPRLRGYRLDERLGTGREGTVYAARLPGVDRDLVVRVVPEARRQRSADFVRTFRRRCPRASRRCPRTAVVPVHDWWREPGAAFVVMQRMRGGTLRDRLQRGAAAGRLRWRRWSAGWVPRSSLRPRPAWRMAGWWRRASCSTGRATPTWPTSRSGRAARRPAGEDVRGSGRGGRRSAQRHGRGRAGPAAVSAATGHGRTGIATTP